MTQKDLASWNAVYLRKTARYLVGGFEWADTHDGFDYWCRIWRKLRHMADEKVADTKKRKRVKS
jgi:hypothetical protein